MGHDKKLEKGLALSHYRKYIKQNDNQAYTNKHQNFAHALQQTCFYRGKLEYFFEETLTQETPTHRPPHNCVNIYSRPR